MSEILNDLKTLQKAYRLGFISELQLCKVVREDDNGIKVGINFLSNDKQAFSNYMLPIITSCKVSKEMVDKFNNIDLSNKSYNLINSQVYILNDENTDFIYLRKYDITEVPSIDELNILILRDELNNVMDNVVTLEEDKQEGFKL